MARATKKKAPAKRRARTDSGEREGAQNGAQSRPAPPRMRAAEIRLRPEPVRARAYPPACF
jgi:hypothetical protein